MVFTPPSWVPQLPIDPPDSITVGEFMQREEFGRRPVSKSRNPFTCGLTGRTYKAPEFYQRAEFLARAYAKRLGWSPNEGTAWDKVIGVFALNTIDYITLAYGAHRLSGIVTPPTPSTPPTSSATSFHRPRGGQGRGRPRGQRLHPRHPGFELEAQYKGRFTTVEELIAEGRGLPELEPLRWSKGQGGRQPAFLCYSSGTSGLPKAVMISHRNIIANIIQHSTYETVGRKSRGVDTQNVLCFLPFSHIYALVVIAHTCTWRGDGIVVLPKFDFTHYLESIQKYRVNQLIVVPPSSSACCRTRTCAASTTSAACASSLAALPPGCRDHSGDPRHVPLLDHWPGLRHDRDRCRRHRSQRARHFPRASGSLLPGLRAKLIDPEGREITAHETPGELLVQGPAVVLGYLNNEKASAETFVHHDDGRWIRTGDEALVAVSPQGNEQIVIVDRIKELIKVKGHQVAPAELEAHILAHPDVDDVAVIQIPDLKSGEVPKAFVVKASHATSRSDQELAAIITKHVEDHKAHYKWIKGGVEFLDAIPKSPSGKILRRLLRDQEKEARRKKGAKL
ncbi:unnamed protein product [Parascedosporium putredinis]|uniref:Acetyl-CoA synthetase-like protein n=1 Tax=Parascedosporium putredinis TaxID=1442378 RepID=A0A9P1M9G9_9PEZI|nr:unnamed protein product [Parascedosporium putredinis]CAI7990749.1 unnamed protein product [Parascedosporium putredinis]